MVARYELPPGTTLRVVSSSGDVTVIAEDRPDVQASEGGQVKTPSSEAALGQSKREERRARSRRRPTAFRILRRLVRGTIRGARKHEHERGPTLEIHAGRGGSQDLQVRCPTGTPVSVGTISGDARLQGQFGDATITTASGDITVDRAAALDARSVSGDLEVGGCSGHCRLHTKSGHIQADATGPAEANTVSGGVRLLNTAGGVTVRTVSGNVDLGTDGTDAVRIRTVSGQIAIRVPSGRLPQTRLRSLSGKVECECRLGADFLLHVDSVSGDIEVEPS
ncbi:MAG: DUF4097 domain-containing protein [Dehalococcoidia bacterium]